VRVDLFTDGQEPNPFVTPCAHALMELLDIEPADRGPGEVGVDCGIGVEGEPVIGLLFWVRADEVGEAARVAVATAWEAAATCGLGPRLYDVVVLPSDAVVLPEDPTYPSSAD